MLRTRTLRRPPGGPSRKMRLVLALVSVVWPGASLAAAGGDEGLAERTRSSAPPIASVDVAFGAPGRTLHPRLSLSAEAHTSALFPHGDFSRNARAGVGYGGSIAGEWAFHRQHALRLGAHYTRAQFTAKASDLYGPATVNLVALRGDYLFSHRWWRPYVGGGIGVNPWRGHIEQPVSQRVQSGRGNALLFTVALGVDLNVLAHVALAPEVSWTYLDGNFKAALWGAGLALRARI